MFCEAWIKALDHSWFDVLCLLPFPAHQRYALVGFVPVCVSYIHLLTHQQLVRRLGRQHLLTNVQQIAQHNNLSHHLAF